MPDVNSVAEGFEHVGDGGQMGPDGRRALAPRFGLLMDSLGDLVWVNRPCEFSYFLCRPRTDSPFLSFFTPPPTFPFPSSNSTPAQRSQRSQRSTGYPRTMSTPTPPSHPFGNPPPFGNPYIAQAFGIAPPPRRTRPCSSTGVTPSPSRSTCGRG